MNATGRPDATGCEHGGTGHRGPCVCAACTPEDCGLAGDITSWEAQAGGLYPGGYRVNGGCSTRCGTGLTSDVTNDDSALPGSLTGFGFTCTGNECHCPAEKFIDSRAGWFASDGAAGENSCDDTCAGRGGLVCTEEKL